MARKLVLSGPAAEAVERLARSAGVSPAELIQRALRREDEAQREEAEPRVQKDANSQPSPSPMSPTDMGVLATLIRRWQEETQPNHGQLPVPVHPSGLPQRAEPNLPKSSEPPTGTSGARRVRVHEIPSEYVPEPTEAAHLGIFITKRLIRGDDPPDIVEPGAQSGPIRDQND